MRSLSFMGIHLAVDALFSYAILRIVLLWINGNIILHNVMPFTVLVVFCAIGVYNLKSQGLIRSVADVLLGFFMFICYRTSMMNHYDILQSQAWFIVVLRGLIGLTLGLLLFTAFKKFVCSYIKAAQIYSIGTDSGVIESFGGCVASLKYTVSIPVLNSIIHSTVNDLFKGVFDKAPSVSASEVSDTDSEGLNAEDVVVEPEPATAPSSISDRLQIFIDNVNSNPLVKMFKGIVKIYVDYIDECVLAYCYKHKELGVFKGCVRGLKSTIVHSGKLLEQVAIVVFVNVIIKIAVVVLYVWVVIKFIRFSFIELVVSFIGYKCVEFMIADSICEPLIMSSILKKFISYELSDEDDNSFSFEELKGMAPSVEKLLKYDKQEVGNNG